MFVDTVMPHMRKQEILQNYKTHPITALQTHKTDEKKEKKTSFGFVTKISHVSEAQGQ